MKQTLLDAAEILDAWRVYPRILIAAYGFVCWHLTLWFETLKNPSTEQMAFAAAVLAMATPLLGLYMGTGRKWDKPDETNR